MHLINGRLVTTKLYRPFKHFKNHEFAFLELGFDGNSSNDSENRKRKWIFDPVTTDLPYEAMSKEYFDEVVAKRRPENLEDAVEFAERITAMFRLPYLRVDFFLLDVIVREPDSDSDRTVTKLYFSEIAVTPDGCNLRWHVDLFHLAFDKRIFADQSRYDQLN